MKDRKWGKSKNVSEPPAWDMDGKAHTSLLWTICLAGWSPPLPGLCIHGCLQVNPSYCRMPSHGIWQWTNPPSPLTLLFCKATGFRGLSGFHDQVIMEGKTARSTMKPVCLTWGPSSSWYICIHNTRTGPFLFLVMVPQSLLNWNLMSVQGGQCSRVINSVSLGHLVKLPVGKGQGHILWWLACFWGQDKQKPKDRN
jgi:hypothetical protein